MLKFTPEMRGIAEIEELAAMDEAFYLTGSRFFGTQRPDSDWDFFTDDFFLQQELKRNGWTQLKENAQYAETTYSKGPVHLQIVPNADRKRQVQTLLAPILSLGQLPKLQAKDLWTLVDQLVKNQEYGR